MFRYISAGFLSVAIHFLIFSPLLDQPVMAMPLSQQTQSVSISFATPVKPTPKKVETPVPEKPQPVVETPTPKKIETKTPVKKTVTKRIVKQKTVTKKVKKETPKKVIAKVEKKPTEKVVEPKEPIAKAAPTETKKAPKEKLTDNKQQTVKKSDGLQEKPQLIQKSRFLSKPTPPKYPRLAKRKGLEGTVTYEVWLDEKGKQVKLLLKDSSGAKVLDVAALKAIKKWKFSPHTINGKSIAHRIYIPISFKLD